VGTGVKGEKDEEQKEEGRKDGLIPKWRNG